MKHEADKNNPGSLLMLTLSMLIFGTIGIFRRMLPLDSALIAFFRGLVGSVFLLPLFFRNRRKKPRPMDKKTAGKLMLSGALIGVNWLLLFEAYNHTSVSVATLCYYMAPTFVILGACMFFREAMTLKKALCAVGALAGMALVSGVVESGLPGKGELKGILLGLGAAGLYAAVVLLNKTVNKTDPYAKTVIQLACAAAVMLPYLLATGGFSGVQWTAGTVGLLLLVGVLHTGVSYALYFASMEGLRTQTVALFSYIDPVAALALSAIILHERLTPLSLLGAALILGSAVIGELPQKQRSTTDGIRTPGRR